MTKLIWLQLLTHIIAVDGLTSIDKLNSANDTYVVQNDMGFTVLTSQEEVEKMHIFTSMYNSSTSCSYCCNRLIDSQRDLLYVFPYTTNCPMIIIDLVTEELISQYFIPGRGNGPDGSGTVEDFIEAAALSDSGDQIFLKIFHFKPKGGPCDIVILNSGRNVTFKTIWYPKYYSHQEYVVKSMIVANETQVLIISTSEIVVIDTSGSFPRFVGALEKFSHFLPLRSGSNLYVKHGPGDWEATEVQRLSVQENGTLLSISTVFKKPSDWSSINQIYDSEGDLIVSGTSSLKLIHNLVYIKGDDVDTILFFQLPKYPSVTLEDVIYESKQSQMGIYSNNFIATCPCDFSGLTPIPLLTPNPTDLLTESPGGSVWYHYDSDSSVIQPLFLIFFLTPMVIMYLLSVIYHSGNCVAARRDHQRQQKLLRKVDPPLQTPSKLPGGFRHSCNECFTYESWYGYKRLFAPLLFLILLGTGVLFHMFVTLNWEIATVALLFGSYGIIIVVILSFWTHSKVVFDDSVRMLYIYTAKPVWGHPVFGSWHHSTEVPSITCPYDNLVSATLHKWGGLRGRRGLMAISSTYIPSRFTYSIDLELTSKGLKKKISIRLNYGLDFTIRCYRSEYDRLDELKNFISQRRDLLLCSTGDSYSPPCYEDL